MLQSKNSLGKQKKQQTTKKWNAKEFAKNTVWNRIRASVCVNLVFQWINGLENGTKWVPKMNVPINRTNVWAEWRPIPFEIKSDINNDLDWHKLRYVVCANDRLFYSTWLFFRSFQFMSAWHDTQSTQEMEKPNTHLLWLCDDGT